MRKTNNKWSTKCCGRCGEPHSGYTGKLDKHGVEYVVCGETNKRMNVSDIIMDIKDIAFVTVWVKS